MGDRRRLSLIVGAFAVAAAVTTGFVLLSLGESGGLLQPRYRLVTYFEDVEGLIGGSPVRLAGKDVGSVEYVDFAAYEPDRPPVRVVIQLDMDVQDRIRNDSIARIGTIGLLGDKYVSVSMGTPRGVVLREGQELASVSPLDLNRALERGTEAIDNIAELAGTVNKVVSEFGTAMGGRKVADATAALSGIISEIQEGDGLLHQLIYEPYEGDHLASIDASLNSLNDLLTAVKEGDGLLHDVIYEPSDLGEPLEDFLRSAGRLDSILTKIDEGEGTLGLLVNDPSLYTDMDALIQGGQRSRVVRGLIRLSTESD
jgi:phospholipid/cholesterol/gamma-HCH transport system substrate-binding protein